jgi:protein O-mannosyl-transferase
VSEATQQPETGSGERGAVHAVPGGPEWRSFVAIGALALAASATGIHNGFTYDDRSIIVQDPRVHHLSHLARLWTETYWPRWMGGGLYRPFTMSAFTAEWVAGHGAAWIFHAVNISLYVAVCLAVYALAALVLPRTLAAVAGALFAVHPVHVEAVGNVVGQSELWAAVFVVMAVVLYITWRRETIAGIPKYAPPDVIPPGDPIGGWKRIATIAGLIALACASKEHAIVAPALIAAAELLVIEDPRPAGTRLRALRPGALLIVAVVLGYVVIRSHVVGAWTGDRANVVFEHLTPGARRWTMLGVVSEWVRLLLWPARLVAEYSPPEIRLHQHFEASLLGSIGLLIALAVLLVVSVRRWPAGAFALAWLAITLVLVSNLIVPTGVILAERTLFLPSVGIVLLVGAVVERLAAVSWNEFAAGAGIGRRLAISAFALVLVLGLAKSAVRQPVWSSNASLFSQGVRDAPYSYRAHDVYAGLLFEAGNRRDGEREARIALHLYSHDGVLYRDLANEYMRAGLCRPAVPLLKRSIAEATVQSDAYVLLARCLLAEGDTAGARKQVLRGVARGPYGAVYHQVLLSVDSAESRRPRLQPVQQPVQQPAQRPGAGRTSARELSAIGGGSGTP